MSPPLHLLGLMPRSWIKAASRLQWRHPLLKRMFDNVATWIRRGDRTVLTGAGRGLRLNVGRSNAGYVLGTSELPVQEAFNLLIQPSMTVFDVGANIGFFSMIAARLVGPNGRVIAFEPLAENAALIARNAALNGFAHVTVRPEAVGASEGEQCFATSEVPSWGRLASLAPPPDRELGKIMVPVRSLDSMIAQSEVPAPALIKIDVEGAELSVLEGARKSVAFFRPLLVIELHGTNRKMAALLNALNYEHIVLGRSGTMDEAPWNAHVVAALRGDQRLAVRRAQLTGPAV